MIWSIVELLCQWLMKNDDLIVVLNHFLLLIYMSESKK